MNLDSFEHLLRVNMGIRPQETALVLHDRPIKRLATAIFQKAMKLCKAKIIEVPAPEADGAEPTAEVARIMRSCDVALLLTSRSLSHTRARREAVSAGTRIASMPNLSLDTLKRAIPCDPRIISALNDRVMRSLKDTVKITTALGTNLRMDISGRKIFGETGLYTEAGQWGNLPAGEVYLAPLEGTTNGTLVVDGSVAGIGALEEPVSIQIKDGVIADIPAKLKQLIPEQYALVGELGIGTNSNAKICGSVLEDEKVYGTAHVAFGNNISMGGTIDVPLHIDAVFKEPTIISGSRTIMKNGKVVE